MMRAMHDTMFFARRTWGPGNGVCDGYDKNDCYDV